MIKVLLIEDHEIVRDGIEQLLEKAEGIRIIGATSTGKEGITIAREQHPDVVILDFQLPDSNGLEVIRKLLRYRPEIKILILTANQNESLALQLLEAGAAGYLSKEQGYRELTQAIQAIFQGHRYISADMARVLALRNVEPNKKIAFDELSPKEMEVVLLISNGLTAEETANHLHIATKTVHSYRYRIFEKLNVKNDLELLRLALKSGITVLDRDPGSPDSTD